MIASGLRVRRAGRLLTEVCGQAILIMAMSAAALAQAGATSPGKTSPDEGHGLTIWPQKLPVTYPHEPYVAGFTLQGNYVPTLHWQVVSGVLPPGIKLDENGRLLGAAERAGEFQFVVQGRDSDQPPKAVQKAFAISVVEALTLEWQVPAHVTANRVDGSVAVTNTIPSDMDLTFDVKAVAENGRATEIGYQHFLLKRGTVGMALPFGDTLPHGAYVIYVNVVGEMTIPRWRIYRQQLKTSGALQVVVGP